jgi:hypothetical protein
MRTSKWHLQLTSWILGIYEITSLIMLCCNGRDVMDAKEIKTEKHSIIALKLLTDYLLHLQSQLSCRPSPTISLASSRRRA